jgi:lysophospholipase L1-like esterase
VTNDYDDLIGDPKFDEAATPLVKRFFDRYSSIACRLARTYAGICIDTYHAFNSPTGTRDAGPLLAPDHTHPNAAGHRLIARLLERAGYRPLHR